MEGNPGRGAALVRLHRGFKATLILFTKWRSNKWQTQLVQQQDAQKW
jgi:hypothetical protein